MKATLFTYRLMVLLWIMLQGLNTYSQVNNLRQLDRKKWKELVKEVKSRRYDPKELSREDNGDGYEDSYYNGEENSNSGESEYTTTYNDQGIYSDKEGDFFDESKDKYNPGNNPYGNGNDNELGPNYGDEDESGGGGSGNSRNGQKYGENDTYRSSEKNNSDTRRIERTPQSSQPSATSGGSSGNSSWLRWVLIGVLAAALIYMILVSFADGNKKTKPVESVESKFENLTITKSELELALEAALRDKNYREAVRIYFIAVIKEMKDNRWIKWEKKKTNHHYINEVAGRPQQPDFITATRVFEVVWYGNRDLALSEYNQLEPVFKKLIQSIH